MLDDGNRRHRCDLCGKAFSRGDALSRHSQLCRMRLNIPIDASHLLFLQQPVAPGHITTGGRPGHIDLIASNHGDAFVRSLETLSATSNLSGMSFGSSQVAPCSFSDQDNFSFRGLKQQKKRSIIYPTDVYDKATTQIEKLAVCQDLVASGQIIKDAEPIPRAVPVASKGASCPRSKPFSCGICNRDFSSGPELYQHQKVHKIPKARLPSRIYYCSACNLYCGNKETESLHKMGTHIKYYMCEDCGIVYDKQRSLRRHLSKALKDKHAEQPYSISSKSTVGALVDDDQSVVINRPDTSDDETIDLEASDNEMERPPTQWPRVVI